MSLCSLVTEAVYEHLQNAASLKRLGKVKPEEIGILPEGKVPAIAGQIWIVISPENIRTINPQQHVRKKVFHFEVDVVRRIRDTPNDRFGRIYTERNENADIHQAIEDEIESFAMFQRLLTKNLEEKIGNSQVVDPSIPDDLRPVKYSVTDEFTHHNTQLNPIKLWANYFLAKVDKSETADQKIAGFKTKSTFSSPIFIANRNPLDCLPLFEEE